MTFVAAGVSLDNGLGYRRPWALSSAERDLSESPHPVPGSSMPIEEAPNVLLEKGSNDVFISHSHSDLELAIELKKRLRILGFVGFVAHEDIEPTREWQEEILAALKRCCGLVVISSQAARESAWVNQEIGAVVGSGRPVFSIKSGCAPWAMLYPYQSVPWRRPPPLADGKVPDRALLESTVPPLNHALERVKLSTSSHLVEGLGATHSFEEARIVAQLLRAREQLKAAEALRLSYLILTNDNIAGCWEAQRQLPHLLRPHRDHLPDSTIRRLVQERFRL